MAPKNTEKEKVEQKARRRPGRVPTSCAECRRLKLRCDRNVPCESCIKRGCAAICPDGSLTTGKGNRLVLANTEELHEKIERLCSRIRDLEDALRTLQAHFSDSPHPLLQDALLTLKAPDSRNDFGQGVHTATGSAPVTVARSESSRMDEDAIVDAFGTLTIGSSGETEFLGKTARSDYLIQAPSKQHPSLSQPFSRLSKRIIEAGCTSSQLSASPDNLEDLAREVYGLLPPLSEALKLCEVYSKDGGYLYTTIPWPQLFDEIMTNVYQAESLTSIRTHHSLALLFSVFALGSHLDPDRPPYSLEAKEFYHLAHVALSLTPPMRGETTLDVVQAVLHMAHFLQLNDLQCMSWSYVGYAVRLGYSIGLHLNSARWRLDDDTSQRRSRLFWGIFQLDTWVAFSFGRPPTTSPAYIDCALPPDIDEVTVQSGQKETGYHSWVWLFTRLLHTVMTTAFGVKMPPYITILDLDRKIRDFPIPSHLRPNCHDSPELEPPELHMRRWWVLSSKEATLLNLHRCYFAEALREQPNDLLKHRYGPSVIATYRSAYRLIQGLKAIPCKFAPRHISKFSLSWSYGLSAAIVMCLLVTRAPSSSLVTSALEQLDIVTSLFEQFSQSSRAARTNLESVQRLCRKAREAMDVSLSEETASLTPTELDRLGGKTHLISECVPSPPEQDRTVTTSPSTAPLAPPQLPTPPPPPPPVAASSSDVFMFGSQEALENVHPTIVQDMKIFDGLESSSLPPFHDIFDLPNGLYPQEMPDIQFPDPSIFGIEMFNSYSTMGNGSSYQPGPPVLDATWQSFVEQLGF